MEFTGYIEGYFGRTLTWPQRRGIFDQLARLGMNRYLYAPKEDPYHRVRWKESYPADWHDELSNLASHAARQGVTLVPALAPGLSYSYSSESDYAVLLAKFRSYLEMGITELALLMDDLPISLPPGSGDGLKSLGHSHGRLLRRLQDDLRSESPSIQIWFCPTVYSDHFVDGEVSECEYILDLAGEIPPDIPIFWTGNDVIPPTIDGQSMGRIADAFQNNIIIWENYYANDYCPSRLFIGPIIGRELDTVNSLRGYMINPTGLYETDRLLLSVTRSFLDGRGEGRAAWERAVEDFELHPYALAVAEYFWSPFTQVPEDFISPELMNAMEDFYDALIVKWQNPLRLEWFPYLYGFMLEAQYLLFDKASDHSWIDRHFPAVIAKKLKKD
jgi:hyaluronoglucosaminidase